MNEDVARDCFVAHYGELALKGGNRAWFVDALVGHLRRSTAGLGVGQVRAYKGRIELFLESGADAVRVAQRLRHAFGVANFTRARRCPPELASVIEAVSALTDIAPPASFRVRARRSDKRFPLPSPEIERRVGAHVHALRGWPVNLLRPEVTVFVEVVPGAAYCAVGREPGPGGLPCGTSGRVMCLLSGGVDSPVAAWRVMRRGCRADVVHFHSQPVTSDRSQTVVRRQVARLARYQGSVALALVPLADVQRHVTATASAALRTVLYRRFMARIAGQLARRHHAAALVTGDAIGQVASQTLENLALVDAAVPLPVLRPLAGSDKDEILAWARQLGTADEPLEAADDCCGVFSPRRVATRTSPGPVAAAEQALDVDGLVHTAMDQTRWETILADWEGGE